MANALTPSLRLGVTGLSRAGKTVFITALVRHLVSSTRLPFFMPSSEGRLVRAYLEPQPDDAVPRFDYEAHLGALAGSPPEWPEGTRNISQLRVTIEYHPRRDLLAAWGPARLHLDIVDYPGEWLIDLPMLDQSFASWSDEAFVLAGETHRADAACEFLGFVEKAGGRPATPEAIAIEGARLYTAYLKAARGSERLSVLGPGRFLLPGELEGSPLLTFFPFPAGIPRGRGSGLPRLLERRFESYKAQVVRPFFRDHFRRLDRQIVLVDALGAADTGPAAIRDLERALSAVLGAFRPRAKSWLARLLGARLDRVLFAAAKADHLHHTSHDRLEALLRLIVDRAAARAAGAGATIEVIAMSAIRATREAEARTGGESLPCIVGVPLPGEALDTRRFDGRAEVAVFPGDLPADARGALGENGPGLDRGGVRFLRFRPPPGIEGPYSATSAPPHIRLDRALDFLLSDWLA